MALYAPELNLARFQIWKLNFPRAYVLAPVAGSRNSSAFPTPLQRAAATQLDSCVAHTRKNQKYGHKESNPTDRPVGRTVALRVQSKRAEFGRQTTEPTEP